MTKVFDKFGHQVYKLNLMCNAIKVLILMRVNYINVHEKVWEPLSLTTFMAELMLPLC